MHRLIASAPVRSPPSGSGSIGGPASAWTPPVSSTPEGERGGSRRRRDERAKAICQDCPVLDECRDHALSTREPYGVWGGMSEEERRAYYERQARRLTDEPA